MQHAMIWFYCLNLWASTFLVFLATAALALLCRRLRKAGLRRSLLLPGLLLWVFFVLYHTLGSRISGAPLPPRWDLFHSYREILQGGNPELLRSNYMNVLLFYPAGALVAALLPDGKKQRVLAAFCVVVLGLFSAWIEVTQYRCQLGWAEADDILHNSLGAVAGLLAYRLCSRLISTLRNR